MDRVKELVLKYDQQVKEDRHYMHMHPELSNQEKETSAFIAKRLREIGLEPTENVGGYGVTVLIEGKNPGKCIGLRADFDALPIQEMTGLPYASQTPNVMHACGHDCHAAMLLGAAAVLNEMKEEMNGCVKLIFQPAEEYSSDSGAPRMIADGVLENPHVDMMIAQHVHPNLFVGQTELIHKTASSFSDPFEIVVHGKKSHASKPEDGVDAIVIAAQIINAIQTIVSRNVGARESAVVTIGEIRGGVRYNVIADEVHLKGTCRNRSEIVRDRIEKNMGEIVTGIASSMGGSAELHYNHGYPATINNPTMLNICKDVMTEVVGDENIIFPEMAGLGGEDFAYYSRKVPSIFYRVGSRNPKDPYYAAHSGNLLVDEECFKIGMEIMVKSVFCALNS